MSEENIRLVERAGDCFNRHDVQGLIDISDDDLEFVSALAGMETGDTAYRGKQVWARYFEVMDQVWTEWKVEDLEVFDAGDERVAATFRLVGTGRSSGVRAGQTIGVAYTMRNGKLWRMRSYLDPAEAFAAVGLER